MPFFRQKNPRAVPNPLPPSPPPARLPERTPSPIMNVLGRELNKVLPQELLTEAHSQLTDSAPPTANHESLRAFLALDWLARTWLSDWALLVPAAGEELTSALAADVLPIRDFRTAEAVGALVMGVSGARDYAESFIAANYKKENFYNRAAVKAARQASATAVADSAGAAVADAAASVILDECLAARTDIALKSVAALSLMHSLDSVWPFIRTWANGPGEFDAKEISIGALAPVAARNSLDPTIEMLQQKGGGLYVELYRLG